MNGGFFNVYGCTFGPQLCICLHKALYGCIFVPIFVYGHTFICVAVDGCVFAPMAAYGCIFFAAYSFSYEGFARTRIG